MASLPYGSWCESVSYFLFWMHCHRKDIWRASLRYEFECGRPNWTHWCKYIYILDGDVMFDFLWFVPVFQLKRLWANAGIWTHKAFVIWLFPMSTFEWLCSRWSWIISILRVAIGEPSSWVISTYANSEWKKHKWSSRWKFRLTWYVCDLVDPDQTNK